MPEFNGGATLLEAIAYGDAAGLPVETWTSARIAERHGRIDRLLPSNENPFFIGSFEPGVWSDDTQLSIAVARALAQANGFNIAALVETHIEAFDETPEVEFKGRTIKRGWGRSTMTALNRLKRGVSPDESGLIGGAGNGILMKLSPLAYWHNERGIGDEERYANDDELTLMTHNSPEAFVTTRVHDDVLQSILTNGYNVDAFIETATNSAAWHELQFHAEPITSEALSYLHRRVSEKDILRHTDAKGFHAPQTLAMAYGALIAHRARFKESVYGSVSLGGDTDSIASIVAAMSLCADSSQRLPDDSDRLDRRDELRAHSEALVKAARS